MCTSKSDRSSSFAWEIMFVDNACECYKKKEFRRFNVNNLFLYYTQFDASGL